MSVKTAVISCSGKGTRFLPATKAIPKELLPVYNKPQVQYLVEECINAGIEHVIITLRPGYEAIMRHFARDIELEIYLSNAGKTHLLKEIEVGTDLDLKMTFVYQDLNLPYGNAAPLYSAKHLLGDEPFIYMYGDDLVLPTTSGVSDLVKAYNNNPDVDAIIALQEMTPEQLAGKYAVCKYKEGTNYISELFEKPTVEQIIEINYVRAASFGRYLFTKKYLEFLNPDNLGKDNEFWTPDAINLLAKSENSKVLTVQISGIWYTTGDPKNMILATLAAAKETGVEKSTIENYLADIYTN